MENGKRNWVFCDGYLPPHGNDPEFEGHEALGEKFVTRKSARYAHSYIHILELKEEDA